MKWTILGLILVGLIAAVSASMLAVTLRADMGPKAILSDHVEVLVASHDLPALAVVKGDWIETKKIRRTEAREKALTDSSQAIGQVLLTPVSKGQALTAAHFASGSSGVQMAAAIPDGARAISIMLSDDTGIQSLLYPGSLVDVVASMRLPTAHGGYSAESVSLTLLQNVQVLAVGRETVVDEDTPNVSDPTNRRARMVTLLVNTDQAEVLQLAATTGKITLAMRNPRDHKVVEVTGTRISDLSKDLAARIAQLAMVEIGQIPTMPDQTQNPPAAADASLASADTARDVTPAPAASDVATPSRVKQSMYWSTTVLRGRTKEVEKFPLPDEKAQH